MSESYLDPAREYRQQKQGEWLRLDFRALVRDFVWPHTNGTVRVEYPLELTNHELDLLAADIGLDELFVPPGELIGEVTTAYYKTATGKYVLGYDHESSFVADDRPKLIALETGRDPDGRSEYVGFCAYYARGQVEAITEDDERIMIPAWEALQSFGYVLYTNKRFEGYAIRHVMHRGRVTHDGRRHKAIEDDSGLRYLIERGKAIYATLGESKEQPHAA